MSGSRNSQQALAAGQDQVDAERERVRALGKFMKNALWQLRGGHRGNPSDLKRSSVLRQYLRR
ncbi:hypothetical protein EIMP300_89550 [Escherichia coli]|uniref:Uncharacterized protein n=1 Tax=Escherichia coli TaxID=562 RepID=A0A8S0G2U9_ECOLX|nr:hypothetical protein EIMP300_89550 [Escherichia coli]